MKFLKIVAIFLILATSSFGANVVMNNLDIKQVHAAGGAFPPAALNQIFPDSSLANVIAGQLGKSAGDMVTQDDLDTITGLIASTKNISDLTGMEYLTNLEELDLSINQISDLTPLSGLIKLTSITLLDNQISDLTPLSTLANLRRLDITYNQISDLTPLASLSALRDLVVQRNQVSDLTPLSGLTNMNWLYLGGNQISDITPLSGLTRLNGLYLFDNQISDISPIIGLTDIFSINLSNNSISDLTPFTGLTNHRYIFINDNLISDVSPIATLTSLSFISMNNNHVGDVSALDGLTTTEVHVNNQVITLPNVIRKPTITLTNTITNYDGTLVSPSQISDDGTYSAPVVSWSGITMSSSNSLNYSFSYNESPYRDFNGIVRFSLDDPGPLVINSQPEITYSIGTVKSEAEFLLDIQAQTNDGTPVTSDFMTTVDMDTLGDYIVTLNAVNALGQRAEPIVVIVHVVETVEPTKNNNSTTNNSSDNNSGLPSTGQNTFEIAGIGAGLVIIGGIIVGVKRRRRK